MKKQDTKKALELLEDTSRYFMKMRNKGKWAQRLSREIDNLLNKTIRR